MFGSLQGEISSLKMVVENLVQQSAKKNGQENVADASKLMPLHTFDNDCVFQGFRKEIQSSDMKKA